MTHSWESEFRRSVASWLIDHGYDVRSNVHLSDTDRYVDIVAESDLSVFAIELENDFEACFKGSAQAAVYAEGIDPEYPNKPVTPIVLTPHVEEPERSQIENRTGIPIVEAWFV